VVGGVDSSGKRRGPSGHFETVWRDDTLTFLTRRDGADGPHTGDWSQRSESWSLDPDGRLQVEIETEAHDRAQQRTLLLYRREYWGAPRVRRSRELEPQSRHALRGSTFDSSSGRGHFDDERVLQDVG
jgi:hypothetical protein